MDEHQLSQYEMAVLAAKLSMDTVREQQQEIAKLRSEVARLKQRLIRGVNTSRKGNRRAV